MTDSKNRNGSTTSSHNRNGSTTPSDDLDRVRDILFGADKRRTNEQITELRNDFELQLQKVRADTERERLSLRTELQQQLKLLQEGKLDRDDLAEMFGGMVTRLGVVAANPASK